MTTEANIYWPFEVRPAEARTDQEAREVRFLEQAHREGFRPYRSFVSDYGASSADGRVGYLLVRGRSRWEAWLGDKSGKIGSLLLDNFDSAAQSVLQWLRGDDVSVIRAVTGCHLAGVAGDGAACCGQ